MTAPRVHQKAYYLLMDLIVYCKELHPPDFLYLCSVMIYPLALKSLIARFTVDFESDRSLAIRFSDGQQIPSALALFTRYI